MTVVQLADDLGRCVEVVNPKAAIVRRISTNLGIYEAVDLQGEILFGTERTHDALDRLYEVALEGKSLWAISATPSEVWHEFKGRPWGQCFRIDDVEIGSGLSGSWNILVSGPGGLDLVLKMWKMRRAKTLGDLSAGNHLGCALDVGGDTAHIHRNAR